MIILQRSPNVVNHFSLAPAGDGQLSENNAAVNQVKGLQNLSFKNRNKSTIDPLPSLYADNNNNRKKKQFHARRATIGGNSDQKDSIGMPPNVSELLNMRP